jgi:hypothetical protein
MAESSATWKLFRASDPPCGAKKQTFSRILGTIGFVYGRVDGGDERIEGDRFVFVFEEHCLPKTVSVFILLGSRAWFARPFLLFRLFRACKQKMK